MDAITPGTRGAAVVDVQRRLQALGHAVDDAGGHYGTATEQALRQFQQQRHLVSDGVLGPETWTALLDAAWRLGDRLLYLTRPWLRGDDVRALQRSLSRLGFDTSLTDGIYGPDTDAALRDFQHNIGIAVDGIAGRATLDHLRTLWRRHQTATSFEVIDRNGGDRRPLSLAGFRIMLDPARGPDAVRHTARGIGEDRIAFDVANRVRGQLVALGAAPLLSRGPDDTPTASQRAGLANQLDADAIVSISCGAMPRSNARGAAGYYFGDGEVHSERGRILADHCVDAVAASLDTVNCHTHASTASVLRESRSPAAIIEIGFITHPDEGDRLADPAYRHRAATALTAGIRRWTTRIDEG
jgi:N-acetylmuramoyl-L-alanine amidase